MIGFNGEAAELVPDVLLVFSGEGADGRTTIALEIEKNQEIRLSPSEKTSQADNEVAT